MKQGQKGLINLLFLFKGVLDKRYARPELDKRRLGELIDLISTIKLHDKDEKDLLRLVYEYFLGRVAGAEGKAAKMKSPQNSLVF